MTMLQNLMEQFTKSKVFKLVALLFIGHIAWWISIHFRGLTEGFENELFTTSYSILALVGGLAGAWYAQKWGGFKSKLGYSLWMLSLGLLSQFLGTILYSYYILVLQVEVPYPSVGDIVFLFSVIFYIIGAYQLIGVAGAKSAVVSFSGKLRAILIPLIILMISYFVLLRGYEVDWSNKVILFFDFGFPIGQAIFVSIALFALTISKDILGGMMRRPVMLLIAALIAQFISDFAFSYQYAHSTVYAGDFLDLFYAISYFLMALALIAIGNMFYKVQES